MLITIFILKCKSKLVIYVSTSTHYYFSYANLFFLCIDLRFNISKIWVIFAWPVWLIDWSILSLILDNSFGFKPESSGKILVIKSLSTSFTVFCIDLTVGWRKSLRQLWPAAISLKRLIEAWNGLIQLIYSLFIFVFPSASARTSSFTELKKPIICLSNMSDVISALKIHSMN